MSEVSVSFHGLFSFHASGEEAFLDLLRGEYPNFAVARPDKVDLEIRFGRAPSPAGLPFFSYVCTKDRISVSKRYKTAKWTLTVEGIDSGSPVVFFDGNRDSRIFFIGEVLEPLMRYLLVRKGICLLHSSCVATDRGATVISGIRHTGKTLLMIDALLKGARLMSDDYTFIDSTGHVYCYPKKVNFFSSHFAEIEGLREIWKTLPLSHKLKMHLFQLTRKLTRDYVVLGYQRFLPEMIPSVGLQDKAALKDVLLITRNPESPFKARESVGIEEACRKLSANNQWEVRNFQELLIAKTYLSEGPVASAWMCKEADLIRNALKASKIHEIVIPDFSPDPLNRYLKAASSVIFS